MSDAAVLLAVSLSRCGRVVQVLCDMPEVCEGKEGILTYMPLPIIEEPFGRITMDIVGALLRSWSGHKYILVVCDYVTRYTEAMALKSIDAEHVAEELIPLYARVGKRFLRTMG